MFIAPLLTTAKTWKSPKCPLVDEWIMKYHSDMKKKDILSFKTTWMDFKGIMLSEISQTEKEKSVSSHLHVESKNKFMDIEKKLVIARDGSW